MINQNILISNVYLSGIVTNKLYTKWTISVYLCQLHDMQYHHRHLQDGHLRDGELGHLEYILSMIAQFILVNFSTCLATLDYFKGRGWIRNRLEDHGYKFEKKILSS